MKVHVHAPGGMHLLSCCDPSATVFELRMIIEQQVTALSPRSPPLASHALRNKEGYLLPGALLVGDALQDGDEVSVVMEKELRPVEDADLTQVLARWRYFQTYTLLTLDSYAQRKERLGPEPVTVLFEMLGSCDAGVVAKASAVLRLALCSAAGGSPNQLGLACNDAESPTYHCGRTVCSVGVSTAFPDVASNCAAIVAACLEHGPTRATMVRGGAARALIHLSRADSKATRTLATRGLLCLTHTEKVARQPGGAASEQKQGREARAGEAATDVSVSVSIDEALDTLDATNIAQVQRVALDSLLRDCGEDGVRQLAVLEGERMVRVFSRVCSSGSGRVIQGLVATVLAALSAFRDEASVVHDNGGFELLVRLVEEGEVDDNFREAEGRGAGGEGKGAERGERVERVAAAALTTVCGREDPACPVGLLVSALVASSSLQVRGVVAEALLPRAKADEHNVLFRHIPGLLSASSQALEGSGEQRALAHALCAMTVKEANKAQLIRYGAPRHFAALLLGDEVTLQRVAAKALANLASSTDDNRAAIIECVQSRLPPLHDVSDSIVAMYMQMIFS